MQQARSQLHSLVFLASILWQRCYARLFSQQSVLRAIIPAMLVMLVIVSLHMRGPFPWP
ncbi:MAG TPA: hypothetical protein VNG51_24720 [Ktedonobacteraceae bacterium]|nr:hypothetical protein [Ktedonobacteraceae bacterium]